MLKRLLTIDWDFFFPIPYGKPEELYYDWGHRENEFFISGFVWAVRHHGFIQGGLDLPRCENFLNFHERFKLGPGANLYIVEHHCQALAVVDGMMREGDRYAEVTNYDAHHDCGYGGEIIEINEEGKLQADSGNWLAVVAKYYDARVEVHYPSWKPLDVEDKPSIAPAVLDHASALAELGPNESIHYDDVILCHSGAWVPPWCDDQWIKFVDSWPDGLERIIVEEQAYKVREMLDSSSLMLGAAGNG